MGFTSKTGQLLIVLLLIAQTGFGAIVAPAFRSAGTKSTGTTSAVTVSDPSGIQQGDLEILIASNINGGTMSITSNGGSSWTAITGTPVDPGATSEKLWVWYRIQQSGDSAPQVTANDHVCAVRLAYKSGTFDLDTPIDSIATGTDTTSNTTFSFATGTSSTQNLSRILCIGTSSVSSISPQVPVMANSSLAGLNSRTNSQTTSGRGGGFGATDGTLNTAGSMGTFTVTYAGASEKAQVAFAIRPITGVPTRRSGSSASGASTASPANPSGLSVGDLDLLIAETKDGQTLSITTSGGSSWTAITGTPVTVASGEDLYGWWRISQSGDSAPTVTTTGDHVLATRGAYIAGSGSWLSNPIGASATAADTNNNTTYSFDPSISPTSSKSMVLVAATARATTAAVPAPFTNATVGNNEQATTVSTSTGTGGAIGIGDYWRGAVADIGTFTGTYTASSPKTSLAITIKPNSPANANQGFFLW